jgi:hypothetical protein
MNSSSPEETTDETTWPWYTYVAPVSWLAYNDIMEGRSRINFSEWNQSPPAAAEVSSILQEGELPPAIYPPLHPSSRLSAAEKQTLASG